MNDEGNMLMEEEYEDMLVDKQPDEDKEAVDQYLNMELTMGAGTDDC